MRSAVALLLQQQQQQQQASGAEIKPLHGLASLVRQLTVRTTRVYAWGSNKFGQLGTGTRADEEFAMAAVSVDALKSTHAVAAVAAGASHVAAVTKKGLVFTWGSGRSGQLGLGKSSLDSTRPFLVGRRSM